MSEYVTRIHTTPLYVLIKIEEAHVIDVAACGSPKVSAATTMVVGGGGSSTLAVLTHVCWIINIILKFLSKKIAIFPQRFKKKKFTIFFVIFHFQKISKLVKKY